MSTVKGFEYSINKGNKHLFITNKVGNEISFKFGDFKGTPMANENMFEETSISITEEQFIELVARLQLESSKISNRLKKKVTLDFGDTPTKKVKK